MTTKIVQYVTGGRVLMAGVPGRRKKGAAFHRCCCASSMGYWTFLHASGDRQCDGGSRRLSRKVSAVLGPLRVSHVIKYFASAIALVLVPLSCFRPIAPVAFLLSTFTDVGLNCERPNYSSVNSL